MDVYVAINSLVYVFDLESHKVFSRGLAVALVIATMVLRLILGLSHGCGLGFKVIRPLDFI